VEAALLGQTISAAIVAFGGGRSKAGPAASLLLLAAPVTSALLDAARRRFSTKAPLAEAARQLAADFPDAAPSEVAGALVVAGYAATDVLEALRTAIPALTPAQATAAIEAVYDLGTLAAVAAEAATPGTSAVVVEGALRARFGAAVTPSVVAQATVVAGLAPREALVALRDSRVFGPALAPAQATAAITLVYGRNTLVARAARDRATGVVVAQEIAALRAAFAPEVEVTHLEQAMIDAGYPAGEVQAGSSGGAVRRP
jgi:hypothetical protein